MTVRELIEWLERLPKEAHAKPVVYHVLIDGDEIESDVDAVEYDLRVVTLR